ncbi:MAG: complex I subunit 5 family protein [Planctomycetota bacterium]
MTALHPGLWAAALVALPLCVGLFSYALGRRAAPLLVWIAPALIITAVGGLLAGLVAQGPVVYQIGGWNPPLGITWRVDGLSAAMLLATAVIVAATGVYASGYFTAGAPAAGNDKALHFWPLVYLLWAALNALFLSADIFNLYVTLELLTLASIGLIALRGSAESLAAALRYLMLGLMASLLYLMGVALLYAAYGTLDMLSLASVVRPDVATAIGASLMVAGLLVKTALFPMHFWLPPAHAAAPAPASALLSALVVKASFYLVLRLWFDVFPALTASLASQSLGALGAGAVVWGGVQALRTERLKTLVAYSTVAQLGYLFLVFPLAPASIAAPVAWYGAILFALSHALAKAAMFLAVGRIQQLTGTDRLDALKGIGQSAPWALSATALAGISLMGLPPSGGFAGKWLMLLGGLETGQWWWVLTLVVGGLLTAGYLFRFWNITIAAPDRPSASAAFDWRSDVPPLALGTLAVLVMFFATPLVELLQIALPHIERISAG